MPELLQNVISSLPQDYAEPRYLIAAGLIVAGGVFAEAVKSRTEVGVQAEGRIMADDEFIEQPGVRKIFQRDRLEQRIGYGLAVGAVALGCVQLASPRTTTTEVHGRATIIIDAGNRASITDMDGGKRSRLQASIDGTLQAIADRDVSVSIIAEANSAVTVDSLTSANKHLDVTRKKLDSTINDPTFQNGESLGDSLVQAVGTGGQGANNIILETANPGSPKEIARMKQIIKRSSATAEFYAVATGNGTGNYRVATQSFSSETDTAALRKLFGKDHVFAAKDTAAVASAIKTIEDKAILLHTKQPNKLPGEIAAALSLGVLGIAIRRRLSGILSMRKG